MQTQALTKPRFAPIDGKPIAQVDRYEAVVLHNAESFTILGHDGRVRTTQTNVPRDVALAHVGQPRKLVYAITREGRSCCVTPRTVKVHAAIYGNGGES